MNITTSTGTKIIIDNITNTETDTLTKVLALVNEVKK
jgi:hypothetical protein